MHDAHAVFRVLLTQVRTDDAEGFGPLSDTHTSGQSFAAGKFRRQQTEIDFFATHG